MPSCSCRRYAECVHSLPATQTAHFSEPGGLLRLGLEVAFFGLRRTDGHIFQPAILTCPKKPPEAYSTTP